MSARPLVVTLLLFASVLAAGNETLVYLRTADAATLDPLLARDAYSNEVLANIHEGLVRFQPHSLAIEPCLAESWERSADGRVWTFTLRPGVFFQDGRPLTSAVVVAHFQQELQRGQRESERWQSLFADIAAVNVVDDRRLRIALKRPRASFLVSLATPAGFIPAPRPPAAAWPAGTGPFRLRAWVTGRHIVLSRYERYWGAPPPLTQVTIRVTAESLRRSLQLKNGDADVVQVRGAREYDELSSSQAVDMLDIPASSSYFLAINTQRPPFDHLAVRQAIAHLINKTSLVRHVFQLLATPAQSLLPPGLLAPDPRASEPAFDPDRAGRLLREAGYGGGFAASLYLAAGPSDSDEIADRLILNARQVNIRLRKVKLPLDKLLDRIQQGAHDLLLIGWNGLIDADSFLRPLFSNDPGNYNFCQYHNPALLQLLDRARQTADAAPRDRLYREAMAIIARDLPLLPLAHRSKIAAKRRTVQGLFFNPQGYLIFRDTRKEMP